MPQQGLEHLCRSAPDDLGFCAPRPAFGSCQIHPGEDTYLMGRRRRCSRKRTRTPSGIWGLQEWRSSICLRWQPRRVLRGRPASVWPIDQWLFARAGESRWRFYAHSPCVRRAVSLCWCCAARHCPSPALPFLRPSLPARRESVSHGIVHFRSCVTVTVTVTVTATHRDTHTGSQWHTV